MKNMMFSLGLLLASSIGFAAANDEGLDEVRAGTLYGSCDFKGQFASGCMEFTDGTWTDATMQDYCVKNSKEGTNPVLVKTECSKAAYNTACVMTTADGSTVSTYVNNMPAFICKKYMSGELVKRPEAGW